MLMTRSLVDVLDVQYAEGVTPSSPRFASLGELPWVCVFTPHLPRRGCAHIHTKN